MSECEHLTWYWDSNETLMVCESCGLRAEEPWTTLEKYNTKKSQAVFSEFKVHFEEVAPTRTPADRDALADALYHQLVIVYDALAQCDPSARERAIGKRTADILERARKERGNE